MGSRSVRVLVISHIGPGIAEYREVPRGTTVAKFVSDLFRLPLDEFLIRRNRRSRCLLDILQDGDRITVTPAEIRGAWVPSYHEFLSYLKAKGFGYARPGKGDHKIYKDASGKHVSVNRQGAKGVDVASIRQLARVLGKSFGDLISDIHAVITA